MANRGLILSSPKVESKGMVLVDQEFLQGFINGQKFLTLQPLLISDFLTLKEIIDVEESWKEIKEGKAESFTNVEEFLKELKT